MQFPVNAPEALEELALAEGRTHPGASHSLGPRSGLLAVFLIGVFAFLVLYATQPLLPLFRQIFNAGEGAVSATVSAATFGVALSAPWMGYAAQRLGRKRVVIASLLVLSVPTLLAATAPSLGVLVLWRFLQGLVLPGIFATAIAYVTEEWAAERVPIVMSLYVSGTVTGGFLGRYLSGEIAELSSWRAGFIVLGGIILVGASVLGRWLPREKSAPAPPLLSRRGQRAWLGIFRPNLLAVYLVAFTMLFSLVAVFTYVTFYLSEPPFGLGTAAISRLFAIYLIGLVVTPLVGMVLPRAGLRRGVMGASALLFAGVFITLAHSLVFVLLGLAMVSSGVFITQAAAASYLRTAAAPQIRALAAGTYLSAYYLGGSTGGMVPALLFGRYGWLGCVLLVATAQLACMATAWFGWE